MNKPMLPILVFGLAAAAMAQKANAQVQVSKRPACDLLSLEELTKHTGAANLEIDRRSSGPDPDSFSDGCTWQAKGGKTPPVAILTVQNIDVPDQMEKLTGKPPAEGRIKVHFGNLMIEAFGGNPPPAKVAGLGDEAFYRDFTNGKGGALLVRRGARVVTFSGSVRKDAYVALAKLVLERI